MRNWLSAASAGLIALAILIAPDALALPIRQSAPPPGVTSVSGTVEIESGDPATGIGVAVFPAGAGSSDALDATRLRAVTVTNGEFNIAGLPPGDYRLALIAAGDVGAFPSRELIARIERAALPFTLRPGESTKIGIVSQSNEPTVMVSARQERLEAIGARPITPPGRLPSPSGRAARPPAPGSISGVITDAQGKPLANVPVSAGRRAQRSAAILPVREIAKTDATGAYRITDLPAGPYLVFTMTYTVPETTLSAPMALAIPTVIDANGRRVAMLTTFYPGTARSDDARIVTVGIDERRDVNFQARSGEVTTVGGVIREAERAGGFVTLSPESMPDQISGRNVQRATLRSDRRFSLPDVPSGTYVITYNDARGWIRKTITVDAAAAGGIELDLDLAANLTVSGRVELHAKRAGTAPDPQQPIVLMLVPPTPTIGQMQRGALISASGEFTTTVPPGEYTFRVIRPDFWQVVSGIIGDRDTADDPVTIDRDRADAHVILADMPTGIRGTVASATGGGVEAGRVVIFPEDATLRIPGSSRVRILTLNPGGTFSTTGLSPGRYLVAIAPPGGVTNRVLTALAATATAVEVVAGETRAVSIVGR